MFETKKITMTIAMLGLGGLALADQLPELIRGPSSAEEIEFTAEPTSEPTDEVTLNPVENEDGETVVVDIEPMEPTPEEPPVTPEPEPLPVIHPQLGQTSMAGTACANWDETPVLLTDHHLFVPVRTFVKRQAGESFKRGSCQFAIPLRVPAGHQLVIRGIRLQHVANLPLGTSARAELEVFFAGGSGPRIEINEVAERVPRHVLNQPDVLTDLRSACGQDLILRGNSSIFIHGGSGVSTSKLDHLVLGYEVRPCADDVN